MILRAAAFGRFIILLLAIAVMAWQGKKKKNGFAFLIISSGIILISALAANAVSYTVPPLTDAVTVTALGQNGMNSKADEVFVAGFSIDGHRAPVEQVTDGKWFWAGDYYGWRNESDSRQPDGVTRSITLGVPVGWKRSIEFQTDERYRGLAEVKTAEGTVTVDTSVQASVALGKSTRGLLVANQMRMLAVYFLIVAAATAVLWLAGRDLKAAAKWSVRHRWHLIYAAIAACQLVYAISFSGTDPLWLDELTTVDHYAKKNSIFQKIFAGEAPQPMISAILFGWYTIAPYGEGWLLLPMEAVTALGIYLVALCGKSIKDEKTGLIAEVLLAMSYVVLQQCSYEYRAYPFLFFGGALVLYLQIRRLHNAGKESIKEIIFLSLAMTFYAGMHYHAVIRVVALFVMDAVLYFRKKVRLRCIVPYLVSGASYLPVAWYLFFHTKGVQKEYSWQPIPGIGEILDLFKYLTSENMLALLLFVFGAIWSLNLYFRNKKHVFSGDAVCIEKHIAPAVCVFVIAFSIVFFCIYGRYINQKATLWTSRYFCDLFVFVAVLVGAGASVLCDWAEASGQGQGQVRSSMLIAFVTVVILGSSYTNLNAAANQVREPYRQAADWVYTHPNYIYNHDTLILTTDDGLPARGWNLYYLAKQGKREQLNVIARNFIKPEELRSYNTVFVVYPHYGLDRMPTELQKVLNEEYTVKETNKAINGLLYLKNQ